MSRVFAIERFMAKVREETKGELGHVVIINQYPWSNLRRREDWPEMDDPDFRAKIIKECGRRSSGVVCARFSAPDSYSDEWSFSAYRRPKQIEPGHCRVCNHAHIRNDRCENTTCGADQTMPVSLWLKSPSRRDDRARKGSWFGKLFHGL